MLPTEKTTGDVKLENIRMLLFGAPKIGKTSLCAAWGDALLLATEKGYASKSVSAVNIVCWKAEGRKFEKDSNGVQDVAFTEVVQEILKGNHKFGTIIIDTGDVLATLCLDYVCKKLGILHISDASWSKGYDLFKKEFDSVLHGLFMSKYGLIITSHTKSKDIVGKFSTTTRITSSLMNQARDIIVPKVSTIGYIKIKTFKIAENQYADKRVISFKGTEIEEAGDRDGKLPDEIELFKDTKKTYELFKQYYAINKVKEEVKT